MSDECGMLFASFLSDFLAEFLSRALVTCVCLFIDRQIVERRDLIIRWGRRAQNTLHVPRSLRVFVDTDPGMLDEKIRFAAWMAFGIGLGINIGGVLFILAPAGKLRNMVWVGLMVICPVCMTLVVWLNLALSRRSLERTSASCEKIPPQQVHRSLAESMWRANSRLVLNSVRNPAYSFPLAELTGRKDRHGFILPGP